MTQFSLDGNIQRTLEALDQWKIPFVVLLAYWVIAGLIVRFVHRRWCSKRRADNPRRYSFWFAFVIAIIFTPSLVGDFWLFAVPAPAILGLVVFFVSGFGAPVFWLSGLVIYVLPIAIVFAIAYAVLRYRDRRLDAPAV